MHDLQHRVAVVTGAGRGVGRAVALRLAEEGMGVLLLARTEADLRSVTEDIAARGGRAIYAAVDVADEVAVGSAMQRAADQLGGLDVLVNNAGVGHRGPVERTSLAEWEQVLRTNLTGPFVCSRAAVPHMRRRGGGCIVSIGSGAGRQGYADMAAYCASKFGLHGLMQSLAQELEAERIKVSVVDPGSVQTDFSGTAARRPNRKLLLPEDVAEAVVYLLRQPDRAWTQEMSLWPFA